jgi:hypothetical protein
VLDRSAEQTTVLLATPVPWFEHHATVMLVAVREITCGPAPPELLDKHVDQLPELALVVEGRDNLVATLMALRVVGVVPYDVAQDAVVLRVNRSHADQYGPTAPAKS